MNPVEIKQTHLTSSHDTPCQRQKRTTEQIIKAVTETELAIALNKIRSAKDSTLQKLSQVIKRGDWEANRRDPDTSCRLCCHQRRAV